MNNINQLPQEQNGNKILNPLDLTKGKYTSNGNYFDFGAEKNSQFGIIIRGDVARMLTDNTAIDVEIAGGSKQREVLIKAGFKVSENGILRVTAHQLQQLMSFDFESGRDSSWMNQTTLGTTLRIKSDKKWLEFLEVNGYISKAASKELAHKNFVIDSATLSSLYEDQRRLAGTTRTGVSGSARFYLSDTDTVKLTIGAERSKEDTLLSSENKTKTTGGAEWTHTFNKEYDASISAITAGPSNSIRIMGNKKGNGSTLSVFAQQNTSRDGIGGVGGNNNTTIGVMGSWELDSVKSKKPNILDVDTIK